MRAICEEGGAEDGHVSFNIDDLQFAAYFVVAAAHLRHVIEHTGRMHCQVCSAVSAV